MLELKSMKSNKSETVSITVTDGYYDFITTIRVPGLTRSNKGLVFLRLRDLMHMDISWEQRVRYLSGQCYKGVFLGECEVLGRRRVCAKETSSNTRQI